MRRILATIKSWFFKPAKEQEYRRCKRCGRRFGDIMRIDQDNCDGGCR